MREPLFKKSVLFFALLLINWTNLFSQSSPGSPYSSFGIGNFSENGSGLIKTIGGCSNALRDSLSLNIKNPASYNSIFRGFSQITSTGFNVRISNFKEQNNTSLYTDFIFSGLQLWFRIYKKSGISLGVTILIIREAEELTKFSSVLPMRYLRTCHLA